MATKTEVAYTKLLNDLTVVELRKKLSARGLSKGNSGLRKSEIISILLADKGYGSKAAAKKAVHTRRHDEYIKKSLKDVRPRIRRVTSKDVLKPVPAHLLLVDDVTPKRTSLKRESPKRTSLKRESLKRVSVSKPRPSSPLSLKPLSLEHKRRTPPPPIPRNVFPVIVNTYAKACKTNDEKEAKRIIGCLCKKFPNIVRCAKKGEKAKIGEIALSSKRQSPDSPRSLSRGSPRSLSRVSPARVSSIRVSPARNIPPPPPPPIFVKKTGVIDITKVKLRPPTSPAPLPPTSKVAVAQPSVVVTQCLPGQTVTSTGACIEVVDVKTTKRMGDARFNEDILDKLSRIRADNDTSSPHRHDDDEDW